MQSRGCRLMASASPGSTGTGHFNPFADITGKAQACPLLR
jgi:hypothetical protein